MTPLRNLVASWQAAPIESASPTRLFLGLTTPRR